MIKTWYTKAVTTDNQRFHCRRRTKVLAYLGGECVQCGFSDPRALQVDHVNSDGAEERRKFSDSAIRIRILAGEPGYQLLCANCNWIKRAERKETRNVTGAHKIVVSGKGQTNARKTHCSNGHPYNTENTYVNPAGSRSCRVCHKAQATAWYQARSGTKVVDKSHG